MQRVNDSQFREVKHQIKRCCNYDKGFCYALDDECAQELTKSLCCKWFRNYVLPENKALYNEICNTGDVSKCKMCGKKYVRTGNRQQYCPDCAKRNDREKARLRKQKQRDLK